MAARTENPASRVRAIRPLRLPDIHPGGSTTDLPQVKNVDPLSLLVDEGYQRGLSKQSLALIKRIVANWSWRAFKPPIVVASGGGYHVIDGQHTAIAAATHPEIKEIPVLVVKAEERAARAEAFVRHNRDRVQMTGTALHHALVAAGDETALTIQQVCERAGARVLRTSPAGDSFAVGDTMAIEVLRALVTRRHAAGARRVIAVCVEAKMAPISAAALRAIELLLFAPEYAGSVTEDSLATTLRELGSRATADARLTAAEHRLPLWRGLAVVLFRKTRKVRGHARVAA